jgi:pyruvate/2-oxoglutarate dehydrogenase complex dihydrolipoamide acyltransferase (E2) component
VYWGSDKYIRVEVKVVRRPVMTMTILADHHKKDAIIAPKFFNEFKATIENPYPFILDLIY